MKALHNVEPSEFRRGEYVGYSARPGYYRIRRRLSGGWYAARYIGAAPVPEGFIFGRTLGHISEKLEALTWEQ